MRIGSRFDKGINGRHVLLALVAFFGVMLIANGILVYFAVATFSGGDTASAYRKGLDYNATLAAAERQAERGWRTEIHYDDKTGRLFLSVIDKAAQPVGGLRVGASLSRPATDREDRTVAMRELAQGVYGADVALAPGLWVISLASSKGSEAGDPIYRLKRRLFVAETP